jgi:hypothetical protein
MLEGLPQPHISPKSMDWRGKIISGELKYILEQNYDIAVQYVQQSCIALDSFSSQINASFRIGSSTMDKRLNDLVLTTRSDFGSFLSDLKKYYTKISPHE